MPKIFIIVHRVNEAACLDKAEMLPYFCVKILWLTFVQDWTKLLLLAPHNNNSCVVIIGRSLYK